MTVNSLRAAFAFPVICGITLIRLTGLLYPNLPVECQILLESSALPLVGWNAHLRPARNFDGFALVESVVLHGLGILLQGSRLLL